MGAQSTATNPPIDVDQAPDSGAGGAGAPSASGQAGTTKLGAHAMRRPGEDEVCFHCGFAADVHASHCPDFRAAMVWGLLRPDHETG